MKKPLRCFLCNSDLPDASQYSIENNNLCKTCFNEVGDWLRRGWTYKEWDEVGAKKYPTLYPESDYYKKLRKY